MLNREFHFRFRSGCWRETPSPTGHICGDEGLSSAVLSGYPGADTYNIFSHFYFLLCWEESNLHLVLAIQSKKSIKWPSVNRLRVHFWLKYPFNRSRLLPFRDPSYFCRATLSNQTFEKTQQQKHLQPNHFPLSQQPQSENGDNRSTFRYPTLFSVIPLSHSTVINMLAQCSLYQL